MELETPMDAKGIKFKFQPRQWEGVPTTFEPEPMLQETQLPGKQEEIKASSCVNNDEPTRSIFCSWDTCWHLITVHTLPKAVVKY